MPTPPELDVTSDPYNVDVQRNPEDPTGFFITMTMGVGLHLYEGCQAGPMRAEGFQIKDTVPDCAVLKRNENGLHWSWVDATFTIKVEM